ncbi:peptidoglycan hydrolase CwlO-like protein [Haloferula luteola]|uniref:Peptidoglycan hydrolase CwlO-like protein n=1 Tax=Haloferula luteola TaxID=595692 RepID=A0A840VBW3_9BACT|nr:hypothetical protein [Haloferula luteola]MBB5351299.1 peptidoglycan hydrolase CwlO-like protein [Haloferula luteola]
MKALFYVIAVLGTGVAAFFSASNKKALSEQLESHEATVSNNRRVSANIDKTQAELDDENTKLTTANEELAVVEASISTLKSDQSSIKREIATVEGELEEQKATLAEAEKARKEIEAALASLGITGPVTMESIQENIRTLTDKQKELNAEVEELTNNNEAAEKSIAQNREEISRLSRRKSERDARMGRNAMSSVVTGVDQNYGFVIIGAGTTSGFKPQTRLLVTRNGRRIAEVTPSSIESTQTVAEIDFDSLAPGVVIQPGDTVILAEPATN